MWHNKETVNNQVAINRFTSDQLHELNTMGPGIVEHSPEWLMRPFAVRFTNLSSEHETPEDFPVLTELQQHQPEESPSQRLNTMSNLHILFEEDSLDSSLPCGQHLRNVDPETESENSENSSSEVLIFNPDFMERSEQHFEQETGENTNSYQMQISVVELNVPTETEYDNVSDTSTNVDENEQTNYDLDYSTFVRHDNIISSTQIQQDILESETAVPIITDESNNLMVVTTDLCDDNIALVNPSESRWLSNFEVTEPTTHANLYLTIGPHNVTGNRRDVLIEKIEHLLINLFKKVASNGELMLQVRNPTDWGNCTFSEEIIKSKPYEDTKMKVINFGSKKSAKQFTAIIFIISEIYKMIISDSNATQREIYYLHTDLLADQRIVSHAIRDICALLGANPWELAINTCTKGVMVGSIVITTNGGHRHDYNNSANGIVLPNDITDIKEVWTDAQFVLIIEKDAIFQRLLNDKIMSRYKFPFIIMTAKGYPDVTSRWLLKQIWEKYNIPMYTLVDADPHGIEIMCTYKYGSLNMAMHSDSLAVSAIQWLGVHPSDIDTLCLKTLSLTHYDQKKLDSMLQRPYISNEIKLELRILKHLDEKCEIESLLLLSSSFLIDNYIPKKIEALRLPQHQHPV